MNYFEAKPAKLLSEYTREKVGNPFGAEEAVDGMYLSNYPSIYSTQCLKAQILV